MLTPTPYATSLEGDDYYTALGRAPESWTVATAPEKDAALIAATRYLDAKYGKRWKGVAASCSQPNDWPRTGVVTPDGCVVSSTEIPDEVKAATIESAALDLSGEVLLGVSAVGGAGRIKRERSKLDVLEEEIEYTGQGKQMGAVSLSSVSYPLIDALLADLLGSGVGYGGQVELVFPERFAVVPHVVDPMTDQPWGWGRS